MDTYLQLLRKHKTSDTIQRRTMFNFLLSHDSPISVRDISQLITTMDRATIYRIINLFQKLEIVKRVNSGWGQTIELSELFHKHHHHMTCSKCSESISFSESSLIDQELKRIEIKHKFLIIGHHIELQGLCVNCRPDNVSYL